jgi:hypothetical protein
MYLCHLLLIVGSGEVVEGDREILAVLCAASYRLWNGTHAKFLTGVASNGRPSVINATNVDTIVCKGTKILKERKSG